MSWLGEKGAEGFWSVVDAPLLMQVSKLVASIEDDDAAPAECRPKKRT